MPHYRETCVPMHRTEEWGRINPGTISGKSGTERSRQVEGKGRMSVSVKLLVIVFLVLMPFFSSSAAEHIVLYRMGDRASGEWNSLKKTLNKKGYKVTMYDVPVTLERHIEIANRMNREKAHLVIAMDLRTSAAPRVLVATPTIRQGRGRFHAMEEVPAIYRDRSLDAATQVALLFGTKAKTLPLFPLLGVNMPGFFISMEVSGDGGEQMFNTLEEGLGKYFGRSDKNEG